MSSYTRVFPTNSVLFERGDIANSMFLIVSGTVSVSNSQAVAQPGNLIGAVAFMQGHRYEYGARCITDVEVVTVSRENFVEIARSEPTLLYAMVKDLASKLQPGEETDRLPRLPATQGSVQGSAMPKDHPEYDRVAADTHQQYLLNRDVCCSVCEMSFMTQTVRPSRLILREIDPDFRHRYRDCEPLWYYIMVCPHCQFTYPHHMFTKIGRKIIDRIAKHLAESQKGEIVFGEPRTLNQVIAAYYQALDCLAAHDAQKAQLANLWHRLLWLYEDEGDKAYAEIATKRALDLYKEEAVNPANKRSLDQDQRLFIVIAELLLRLQEDGEALNYLRNVANAKVGNPALIRMASDRIQDIRWKKREQQAR